MIEQDIRKMVNKYFADMVRHEINMHILTIKASCQTDAEWKEAIEIYKDTIHLKWGYPALQILWEEVRES